MTIAEDRVQAFEQQTSPEMVAVSRLAGLRATGVVATARPWDGWLLDGSIGSEVDQPWLIITPDDVTIEIVFGLDTSFLSARRVLLRLLADRWSVVVRVNPTMLPEACRLLSDLPLSIDTWARV